MPYARSRTSAGIPCNDTRDTDKHELMLIRAGHHLWALRRRKTVSPSECEAIDAALETIWEAKRQYRAELALRLKEESAKIAARFRRNDGGM